MKSQTWDSSACSNAVFIKIRKIVAADVRMDASETVTAPDVNKGLR